MGLCQSTQQGDIINTTNDYELVIRASKELEHVLDSCFGASGKGLHEKCSSVENTLSPDLVRKIRYLATMRNKLVHEYGFNEIPDRARFTSDFTVARAELQQLLAKHGKRPPGQSNDLCVIM